MNANFTTWRKDSCCDVSLDANQTIHSGKTKVHSIVTFSTRTTSIIRVFVKVLIVFAIA